MWCLDRREVTLVMTNHFKGFSLVSCICRYGCDAMAIEYEIETENEGLGF